MALSEQDLLHLIDKVRPWKHGDRRAPHKPLLLLMALGRLQRGEDRLVAFTEVEDNLRRMLKKYGPSRDKYRPEYPFWRLQNDSMWEVHGSAALAQVLTTVDPPKGEILQSSGGLPKPIFDLLRDRPDLVERLAVAILDEHFEDTYEGRLLADVGLRIDGYSWARRRKRDPRFRLLVLDAYEGRCAVCGLDAVLEGDPVGLEAAHVKSHKHRGPDTVNNGLCMCALHHEAFDLGVLGLTHDHRVLVSDWLRGGASVDEYFRRYHRERLRGPVVGAASVDAKHIEWHWKNAGLSWIVLAVVLGPRPPEGTGMIALIFILSGRSPGARSGPSRRTSTGVLGITRMATQLQTSLIPAVGLPPVRLSGSRREVSWKSSYP